jgi:hypothetical protein
VRRRLRNILTALSLLLCVAVAGCGVRERFKWDMICHRSRFAEWLFWSRDGSLTVGRAAGDAGGGVFTFHDGWDWETEQVQGPSSWGAFSYEGPGKAGQRRRGFVWVEFPHWFGALVFAALPAVRLARRLSRARWPVGYCPACGYDLRATPGRCPECGTHGTVRDGRR